MYKISQYTKLIFQLMFFSLELDAFHGQRVQLPDPLLRERVADRGGRVTLPALGTRGEISQHLGPAGRADQVLLGAGEDFRSGVWDLQADGALQVGLLLPDDFLLLLDTRGEEHEKCLLLVSLLSSPFCHGHSRLGTTRVFLRFTILIFIFK